MLIVMLLYDAYADASDPFLSLLPLPCPVRGCTTPYAWSGQAGEILILP